MQIEKETTSIRNMFYLVAAIVITGVVTQYKWGISGNDYWWHLKVGEWIFQNHSVPNVGIFSWYAMDNNLEWVSHEWLSEVLLYMIHNLSGNLGVFLFSIIACIGLICIIMKVNIKGINNNILLSAPFLFFSVIILPIFFYGRPQIFSAYLLFFTLLCLYRYEREESKLIYLLPIVSILWTNLHGGSANLPYILCLIFAVSGLFKLNFARLEAVRNSKKETKTLFIIALLSFLATAISPHGIKMLVYPYINMGDSLMLSIISEWASPDAKDLGELVACILPILFVSLILLLSNKKMKLTDLLIFLLFAYLSFRSVRFTLLFFIASSFFVFEYMPLINKEEVKTKYTKRLNYSIFFILLIINIFSAAQIYDLARDNKLISIALENKYIDLIKQDNPQKLLNDYNYGETLIYNDIPTFIDARADIFTKHNLADAIYLLYMNPPKPFAAGTNQDNVANSIFNVESLIEKYQFDAFLVESNRSLATYLYSHPEKYKLQMSDENTCYFIIIEE